jgi:transposase InsO family protein
MYRILEDNQSVGERRDQLTHPQYSKPELLASGPNEVWSWDITKLRGPEKWTYYYLYVIIDIYSRCVVGWMLAHRESADLAKNLIQETIEKQQVPADQLILHSDRGPSMASHSVAHLLANLGVTKSHKADVWQEELESGRYNTIEELADAKKVGRTYASRVMRLTSFCPQIVESVLNGNETDGLSLRQLHKGIPDCWKEQMELIAS